MTKQTANTAKPSASNVQASKPSALDVQASKRSAFGERVTQFATQSVAMDSEHKARKLSLLSETVLSYGTMLDQNDWKTWVKALFEKAFEGVAGSNISAMAPVVVALSRGFKPNPGEGFDAFKARCMAWLREQPDTVYKVEEKPPRNPAPAGDSNAPKGDKSGREGADHGKVTTWNRETVLEWLSGGDSGTLWALETVLAYRTDNVFLDALEKAMTEAEARKTSPRARPKAA
jgi:hypothetical protein